MNVSQGGGVKPTVACSPLLSADTGCSTGRGGFRKLELMIAFAVSPVSVEVQQS